MGTTSRNKSRSRGATGPRTCLGGTICIRGRRPTFPGKRTTCGPGYPPDIARLSMGIRTAYDKARTKRAAILYQHHSKQAPKYSKMRLLVTSPRPFMCNKSLSIIQFVCRSTDSVYLRRPRAVIGGSRMPWRPGENACGYTAS